MLEWIKTVIEAIGYSGIALLMIIENIFPPLPSELIMPFSGFVSSRGSLTLTGVIIAGTVGSLAGTMPFYFIGRKLEETQLKRWANKHGFWIMVSAEDIHNANRWFDRYGHTAVFAGRLVPGIRTLISIPAGVNNMNFLLFTLLSLAGTGLWTGILAYLGNILGQHYDKVEHYLSPVTYIVIGGFIGWYVYHIAKRLIQTKK
ncbi:MAG TPA: DedA family protein [Fodinibius sp.]|nr:DedA family protein [Fodinibius sp.]